MEQMGWKEVMWAGFQSGVLGRERNEVARLAVVGVAEVLFGDDLVSDELFEFFDVGEAALCCARPEEVVVYVDLEDSACAGPKGYFADFGDESGE